MPRPRLLLLAALVALLTVLLGASAAPADAAKRKVPFGFFGTVLNNSQIDRMSDATLDAQMASMARNGVESVRFSLSWQIAEPAQGTYNFSTSDRMAAAAARHGLDLLPIVLHTPRWASSQPTRANYYLHAPRDPALYANFMRVLVQRYGPRGSFWATSGTPRVPIRSWQIWNEPAADFFWATRPWPRSYARLLKAAYRAVHRADRRATVVLGSLAGVTSSTPWAQMRNLYKAGAKGSFDVVSLHFFSSSSSVRVTTSQTLEIATRIRREMRRARDRRKKIWFTELTWTAAQGKIPKRALFGFETTARGQAARLKAVFSRLARDRKKRGIGRVYWYNWASEYIPRFAPGGPGALTFQYAGLNKVDNVTFTPLRVLRTYASTAARYEGCRKTTNARRCR
ncbi:MAG TPA: glycosyl hydrolase 53 family protein [Thermoleophilaceae bacterium]|nr:glycosyl hydrolase 53 family protein [Thermoleophilaceae bacterium]